MKEFFANLKKSTRITLVSCVSFVALTLLILFFFVMFPITPSEKVIASLGRENVAKSSEVSDTVTTTAVTTDDVLVSRTSTTTTTSKVSRTNFTITVTTGDGFYSGNYIATGVYPYESNYSDTTSTSASDGSWIPEDDEYDYPLPGDEPSTQPVDNGSPTYIEPITEDPVTYDPGNVDDPGTSDPGTIDDPGTTDPIVVDDPGTDTPVDPPADTGDSGNSETAE